MDELAKAIAGALRTVLDRGGRFPFATCCLAANGSMVYGRYDAGTGCGVWVPLADYMVDDAMVLPVNMLLIDGNGAAHRIIIETSGQPVYH